MTAAPSSASRCAPSSIPARSSPRWRRAILGRTNGEDLRDPATNKIVVKRGTLMEETHVDAIQQAGIQEVKIRSALTCELVNGICGKCYGRDLARGTPVNHG